MNEKYRTQGADSSAGNSSAWIVRMIAGLCACSLAAVLSAGCEFDSGKIEEPAPPAGQSAAASGAPTSPDGESAANSGNTNQTIYAQMQGIDNSPFMGEQYDGTGCDTLSLNDGPGGFVSNPENVRGTLKFVFPVSYRDQIQRVTVYTPEGVFFDEFYRQLPNEHDGRPRYYGTMPIEVYPAGLFLKVLMKDGSCRTVQIPNPRQRYT